MLYNNISQDETSMSKIVSHKAMTITSCE